MEPNGSNSTARLRVSDRKVEGAVLAASLAVDPDGRTEVDAILLKMADELKAVRDRARQRLKGVSGKAAHAGVVVTACACERSQTTVAPTDE
jgi:hypothetical protein